MDPSNNIPTSPNTVVSTNDLLNNRNPPPVIRQPATLHLDTQPSNFSNIQRQLIFDN